MTRVLGVLLTILLLASCNSAAPAKGPNGQGGSGGSGGTGGASGSGGSGGTTCPDDDGDGFTAKTCGGTDCNDTDPAVYPGAPEICKDGIDQNCDGSADEGCDCSVGQMQACWTFADASRRNVGACRDGFQRCGSDGKWSVCTGEVDPTAEPAECDGIDQDCDGKDVAACAGCLDHEICGNGIDDNCNTTVDDPDTCNGSCQPSETPLPDSMACCSDAARYTYECSAVPGLPDCTAPERVCVTLGQGSCVKRCTGNTCVCGRPANPQPTEVPDCGFETACNRLGCENRAGQDCYTGPPATLGVGICHGGLASCTSSAWGACDGEVLPGVEACGNGIDDDCDGLIDEDDGTGHPCARTDCVSDEACDNGLDDDCDGFVDEGCAAGDDQQACYPGPALTRHVGTCKDGVQKKQGDGYWGPCEGDVVPGPERCSDGKDTDCNGSGGPGKPEDKGCCRPAGDETCNGIDDDCDGLIDEGLLNSCGTCDASCGGALAIDDLDTCIGTARVCLGLKPVTGGLSVNIDGALQPDPGIYFSPTQQTMRRFDTSLGEAPWDHTFAGNDHFVAASPDGSLWAYSYDDQAMIHLDSDGQQLCTFANPLLSGLEGLAIDEGGAAWVVYDDSMSAHLYEFPASSYAAGTCVPRNLGAKDPWIVLNAHGFWRVVMGPPPDLWIIGNGTGTSLRVNRTTLAQTNIITPDIWPGGGHPEVDDSGNIWFTSNSGVVTEIPAGDDGSHANTFNGVSMEELTNVGDGLIWGITEGTWQLASLDPATSKKTPVDLPGKITEAHYPTSDSSGRIWIEGITTTSSRMMASYDPATQTWQTYATQVPAVSFADGDTFRSSALQQRFALPSGSFQQDVDGGYGLTSWKSLSWKAQIPADGHLQVTFKVADDLGKLTAAKTCGPFLTSPADLSTCTGGEAPRGRFVRVKVDMIAAAKDSPVLSSLELDYEHP